MRRLVTKKDLGRVIGCAILAFVTVSGQAAAAEKTVPGSEAQIQLSFAPVVKKVAPAVVNVYTRRVVKTQSPFSQFFNDPLFRRFFGDDLGSSVPRERIERSLGSGVIVSADGVIVTNNHVIGDADEITVALADRREFPAKVVMADKSADLAVLKIDVGDEKLPYLTLRDSDTIEVGDLVLAIGNPFGVGQTVTSGIVSAVARTNVGVSDYQSFIQTDAAINPGNSGGALVTLDGKLVGINSEIYSRSGGSIGIGFAIPSDMVSTVVTAAMHGGKVVRPWIGASGQAVTSDIAKSIGLDRPMGVLVDEIYKGGPADQAGIRDGDVIISVNGKEVFSPEGLRFRLRIGEKNVGNEVPVTLLRSGAKREVKVKIEAAPEVPPRNVTVLEGEYLFNGIKVANLSPAYAEELNMDPMQSGVVVLGLARQSPALHYGLLQPGDIIVEVNDKRVTTVKDLKAALEIKDGFSYRIRRGNRVIECAQTGNNGFTCRQ